MNVTNIDLNSRTAKVIANRVMRDLGMQVRTRFTPVESHYNFQIGDKLRREILLTDQEYVERDKRLVRGRWVPSVEYRITGDPEKLENMLIQSVAQLVEQSNRFSKYRNIK